MMVLTNQKEGGEFVFKTKQTFKTRVNKTSFVWIISQNFHKLNSINTESIHPLHKIFVKVFSFKRIFSWTFRKLIKTRMRKKDNIKRRNTQPFCNGSLPITRESNPKPELDFHYAYRILRSNLQFAPWKKRLRHTTLGSSFNKSLRETYP